ncbi:MAG: dTMP kinase [Planctomycetota bacterium]
MRGRFVVIEGVDGAGKTTQLKALAAWLEARGRAVLPLREPGGTAIGEEIRRILLDRTHAAMTTETELCLYCAARAQIVREVIAPALAAGRDVLCDRFTLSTLVYQSRLGGLPLKTVQALCDFAMGATRPDLCLLLDLPVAESLARRTARDRGHGGADRMERKLRHALEALRAGYRSLAKKAGYPCRRIDATGTPETVQARLQAALAPLFDARSSQRQARRPRRAAARRTSP